MLETLLGLFTAAVVSGIVPLVNAELLVIGAAAVLPAVGIPLVAVVSTAGQMVTKAVLFVLARWAPEKLPARARRMLDRSAEAVAAREGATSSLLFTSAATGLPPFYGVSLAAGALGVSMPRFLLAGGVGRLIRFGVLAWIGHTAGSGAADLFASGGLASVWGG